MSAPRRNWWPFVLNMVRDYPQRLRDYEQLKVQKVTASAGNAPGGGSASRVTETVALRQLPPQEQREFDAVHSALERTKRMKEGSLRLKVVKMTLWQGYSIGGAALLASVSNTTARRYRWQFLMTVGQCYGFMTEEEYRAMVRKEFGNTEKEEKRNPKAKKV